MSEFRSDTRHLTPNHAIRLKPDLRTAAADQLHEPVVEVGEHVASEAIAARVLAEGNGAAGDVEQSQISANLVGRVGFAVSGSCEQTGNAAKFVDPPQWAQARGQGTVDRDRASKLARVVPGCAECHCAAGAAADEENSLLVNVESLAGDGDAIHDARVGRLDGVGRLPPAESPAVALVVASAAGGDGHVVSHAHQRHDLPQFLLITGGIVQPDEKRVRIPLLVMDGCERGVRQVEVALGAAARRRDQFMQMVGFSG